MGKKALNIVKNVLVWTFVAFAVIMMLFTIFSVNTFDKTDRDIFGLKFFIVQTDSMSDTFRAGDIVVVNEVDPTTLVAGDIITFISQNENSFNETITHKIRSLTKDEHGDNGFITYGTTTDSDDETVVTYPYILGKYSFHLPWLGHFFQFLKTTPGYIICILVPFLLLIIYNGVVAIGAFRRYKKEEMQELDEEKKKLEEERRQSLEMMAELQKLKEQLAAQQGATTAQPTESAAEPTESTAAENEAQNKTED
ncbi:MAG: signal peptidase I [Clostridia bacterium]|nr:signal peptidase I [Clostridia bacterium]